MEQQKILRSILYLTFLWALYWSPSFAQEQTTSDSTDFAFIPAIAFNSDQGFIFGGVVNLYKYKDETRPFYSYTVLSGIFSTKGLANFSVFYDKPHAFGKDLRITTGLYGGRFFEDAFYGIGNYQKITDSPPGLPNYYLFQSFSLGLESIGRFPIKKVSDYQQLDASLLVDLVYETPWENDTDRLIMRELPIGVEGGKSFMLGTGLTWEGRDSEFTPTKGNYASISFRTGQKLWGSDYTLSLLRYDLRQYATFHLIKDITFATRFSSIHSYGDVPYWKIPYAGDDETLRGYVYRRFMDDNVSILNTELRTWLFDFPSWTTKIGGTLFFDTGRTYPRGSSLSDITSDIKYTFGFGGLFSLFTPDFIIRGDFGFSDEGMGVYFQIGYMF